MKPYFEARIIRGNALALPLADASVDLVVTSPPYFGLRSYQDGGEHYDGQIGSEATPAEFVDALIAATREMVRVLKPSGSIWVNLGDKYAGVNIGTTSGHQGGTISASAYDRHIGQGRETRDGGVRQKSLIGVPWRYALRCIDDLGLILRAEVIWSKPNGLPESVTDRVRRSHETWFHFTKAPKYYSAVDEIREEYDGAQPRTAKTWDERKSLGHPLRHGNTGGGASLGVPVSMAYNALGKLPGSVWTIPTQPLKVPAELGIDHFAAFPMEWPRRIIQGWSPAGVCTACGEGRRPVTDRKPMEWRPSPTIAGRQAPATARKPMSGTMLSPAETTITGYVCACPDATAPTTPAVVLDGFGGTGTTALVAKALGRHGISVDMSADYCRLAQWRTTDPGELARAMEVEKPVVQVDGQISMLDLLDGEPA